MPTSGHTRILGRCPSATYAAADGRSGWQRGGHGEPGASIPRLSQGQFYASKAAYQLLGHAQTTPDVLQGPHRQLVAQQLHVPGTYLLVEDTTELSWPEAAERRAGLGPVGPGKATSQGVLLHSLVAAAWSDPDPDPAAKRPALPLLGLLDQQFHVREPVPAAEKAPPTAAPAPARAACASRPCGPKACGPSGARLRARAGWWWPTVGPTSTSICSSARPRAWGSWCGPPKTGPWWRGPPKRRPAASSRWPGPSPARVRLPWPCADGRASRRATSSCR